MNNLVERTRRIVERLLPWFDREERDQRAARTERGRRRAIATRIRTERIMARADHDLGSYSRVRLPR